MTYTVSSGTLNPSIPYHTSLIVRPSVTACYCVETDALSFFTRSLSKVTIKRDMHLI